MSRDGRRSAREVIRDADVSLLDIVDHVLDQGVVLEGELVLGLADVDLIHVRLAALLCAAGRVPLMGERR